MFGVIESRVAYIVFGHISELSYEHQKRHDEHIEGIMMLFVVAIIDEKI